jgi:hypothetical protein
MAVPTSQENAQDGDHVVDVSLLRDLAKKSLVDGLNAVRITWPSILRNQRISLG